MGDDARTKKVTRTGQARRAVDRPAAEQRATESALDDVKAETPFPLSQVITDIERALEHKGFDDRIAEKLAGDPAWG
ncbi:hypothetical protein ACF05W_32180 [Streptomyces lydicus]|uniref:hypothetical protein n=1 Tax=Streptomyces lydicus TaxID=47763 RepID=UPI0036FB798C